MTTEKILELVEDYFKMEYRDIQLVVKHHQILYDDTEYLGSRHVNATLQRCLGVALFVQSMDIPYEEVNKLYEEYREKIEKVLDNN